MYRAVAIVLAILVAGSLAFVAATSALAELRVVESNSPAYRVGSIWPDNTVFDLKPDERVRVLVLPSNQTRVFEGKGERSLTEPVGRRGASSRKAESRDCIEVNKCTPVTVFFGTNRGRQDTARYNSFGPERSQELSLGSATITVPKSHGRGQIERPGLFDWSNEDPTKHFVIVKDGVTVFVSVADFVARMRQERARLTNFSDHAFVFVHGFNVTFEGALFRTAQIAYDLGGVVDGANVQFGLPFAFSWPSKASLSAYAADEDSARISVARLKPFLELVVKDSGAKNVHVIAHSMGNQVVLRTLEALARERPQVRFNQIVLAAPDVDRDEFEQIAKGVSTMAEGVTLYASSTDVALNVSKRVRAGQMRAGDVGRNGPLVLAGVDSIDISAAGTDIFALNHDVYITGAVLVNDMGLLLGKGVHPPSARTPVFEQRVTKDGRYWAYSK
jgi:esterase/lipase superfamily enzyme